jgi:hypothetical protein
LPGKGVGELILSAWNIAKVKPLERARQVKYVSAEACVGLTRSEIASKFVPHRVVVRTDFDSGESPLSREFECSEDREQFTSASCHIRVCLRDFFYDWSTTFLTNTLLHNNRYSGNFREGIVRGVDGQSLDPFGHGYYRVRLTTALQLRPPPATIRLQQQARQAAGV